MTAGSYIYRFADFELNGENYELFRGGERISLTEKEGKILLLLVQHPNIIITKDEFLDKVWGTESEVEESNITVHMSRLRDKLGDKRSFIDTYRKEGGGYIFVGEVSRQKNQEHFSVSDIFDDDEANFEEDRSAKGRPNFGKPNPDKSEEIELPLVFGRREMIGAGFGMIAAIILFYIGYFLKTCFDGCFEQNTYILLTTVFYAVLTGIGVFLECAYQFDKYGWRAAKMLPPVFLVQAGAMFAALAAAENHLPDNVALAFVSGCLILATGAGIVCFMGSYILPNKPITAARTPTQSAFAAFCKNIFLYFFPIYAIFGLLVFCLINSSTAASVSTAYPIGFFVLLLVFFVTSHFSTNVLLQNLLTPKDGEEYKYYGLFSSLIMFRTFFMFGAALISLIYYFSITVS